MKSELRFVLSILSLIALLPIAAQSFGTEAERTAIVPRPMKVEWQQDGFQLHSDTQINFWDDSAKGEAEMLASLLRPATDLPLPVSRGPIALSKPGLRIELLTNRPLENTLGKEGYVFRVNRNEIWIAAATPAGLFYGSQTLLQLLPPAIYAKSKQEDVKWTVPCCKIEDKPLFPWRGLLVDEGRHFFGKDFVKHTIDLLAIHKMNTLHWHLTEDQGWRIEIKKYPKLTEIGSWRNETEHDGKRYGGFYTQDDIREIVTYAAKRHVTIVPEIEMPGHSLGALTAYPQFSCTGGPFKVRTLWGVEKDV